MIQAGIGAGLQQPAYKQGITLNQPVGPRPDAPEVKKGQTVGEQDKAKTFAPLRSAFKNLTEKGASDTEILNAFEGLQTPQYQKLVGEIKAARSSYGDSQTVVGLEIFLDEAAGEPSKARKSGEDIATQRGWQTAIHDPAYMAQTLQPFGDILAQDIARPALTASVGAIGAGVKGTAAAAQGENVNEAIRQPIDVWGIGNINPNAMTPMELTGMAGKFGLLMGSGLIGKGTNAAVNYVGQKLASHPVISFLARKGMQYTTSAAQTGAYSGFNAMSENRTPEEVWEATQQGAAVGAVVAPVFDAVFNYKAIKKAVVSKLAEHAGLDKRANPDLVADFMADPGKIETTVVKAKEAVKVAKANVSKEFGNKLKNEYSKEMGTFVPTQGVKAKADEVINNLPANMGLRIEAGGSQQYATYATPPIKTLDISASRLPKTQAKAIKAWYDSIQALPDEQVASSFYDNLRQISDSLTYNQSATYVNTVDEAVGKQFDGIMRNALTTAVPKLKPLFEDYATFKNALNEIGSKLNTVDSGITYLKNMEGSGKFGRLGTMQMIEEKSGIKFMDEVIAADTAKIISAGKGGLLNRTLGILVGASAGSAVAGGAGAGWGAAIGSVAADVAGKNVNTRSLYNALVMAGKSYPVTTAFTSPLFSAALTKVFRHHSLARNSSFAEFKRGYRSENPFATNDDIEQAYLETYATTEQ